MSESLASPAALGGSRLSRSGGFVRRDGEWYSPNGDAISDAGTLTRLKKLAIPPAWLHVWAAEDSSARVQATGVDSRGRTQYRYAATATSAAASIKFDHMLDFAAALPKVRSQVDADLRTGMGHQTLSARPVIASLVRLLDRGLFRVGNERYARDNHTYGLTTIRRNQLTVRSAAISFDFIGKEHIEHHIELQDEGIARVLRQLLDQPLSPDEPLFALHEEKGGRAVHSTEVNAYLHAHTDAPATAKMFRTWGATVAAASVMAGANANIESASKTLKNRAVEAAARLLGDTPAVTRASYIHPLVFASGSLPGLSSPVADASGRLGTDAVDVIFADAAVQSAVLAALRASSR